MNADDDICRDDSDAGRTLFGTKVAWADKKKIMYLPGYDLIESCF